MMAGMFPEEVNCNLISNEMSREKARRGERQRVNVKLSRGPQGHSDATFSSARTYCECQETLRQDH